MSYDEWLSVIERLWRGSYSFQEVTDVRLKILGIFFFQAEDGIRDKGMWLEFRRVLFRSNEYYVSYQDLDLFLQGVPIFEDFDSTKDKENLSKYAQQNSTDKGIRMERHRTVIVLQK